VFGDRYQRHSTAILSDQRLPGGPGAQYIVRSFSIYVSNRCAAPNMHRRPVQSVLTSRLTLPNI